MPVWATWIANYIWGKIVPIVTDWVANLWKKKKIDREVDEESDEIEELREKAKEFAKNNPGVPLPKELEDALRVAAGKRARGL